MKHKLVILEKFIIIKLRWEYPNVYKACLAVCRQRFFISRNLIYRNYNSKLNIIFFVHIPKTGGTALNHFFKNHLHKYGPRNIGITFPPYKKQWFYDEIQMLASAKKGLFYVHYHHGGPGLLETYDSLKALKQQVAQNGGKLVFCTVLREPYSRMISDLNYCNTPLDQIESTIIKKHDLMSRYILFNHPAQWTENSKDFSDEDLNKVVNLFDVIGTTDNLDEFAQKALNKIGIYDENICVKKRNASKKNKNYTIDKNKFNKLNQKDIELYRSITQKNVEAV